MTCGFGAGGLQGPCSDRRCVGGPGHLASEKPSFARRVQVLRCPHVVLRCPHLVTHVPRPVVPTNSLLLPINMRPIGLAARTAACNVFCVCAMFECQSTCHQSTFHGHVFHIFRARARTLEILTSGSRVRREEKESRGGGTTHGATMALDSDLLIEYD